MTSVDERAPAPRHISSIGENKFDDLVDLAALIPRLPREPVRLRRRFWVLLGVIALGLALDLRIALRRERALVPAATMAKARAMVLEERRPGNLVVHSPLLTMTELAPLGDLPAKPDLPPRDMRRTRRMLVIDLAASPMFGLGRESRREALGDGVVLRVFEPPGGQPLTMFDFVADIDRVELRIERPRGTVTSQCTAPRTEGGRSCPNEADWLYLAPRMLMIENKNVECVWAHPTTGGDLVFTLPPMPEAGAGRRLMLEIASGMTDDAVRQTPDGASVRTDVEQAGRIKGGVTLVNRIGWSRTEIAIDPNVPVALRVSTPRDGRRHHCLTARVVEAEAK